MSLEMAHVNSRCNYSTTCIHVAHRQNMRCSLAQNSKHFFRTSNVTTQASVDHMKTHLNKTTNDLTNSIDCDVDGIEK